MNESNEMYENKKHIGKKILTVITAIAGICTITGVSLFGLISCSANNFATINEYNIFIFKDYYTTEQKLVAYYVPRCKEQIIPLEEWKQCTKLQLYYIRNGIYAYGGRRFKGDFYNVFDWYDGHILPKDFSDDKLNYLQNRNIANILKVEKSGNYLIK